MVKIVEEGSINSTTNDSDSTVPVSSLDIPPESPIEQIQRLNDIIAKYPWLQYADSLVDMPKPLNEIDRHFVASTIFTITCGALSVIVYADGAEIYGLLAVIGGVTANLTQNLMFGKKTYESFRDMITHGRYGELAATGLAGILTSVPMTFAEYIFSHGNYLKTSFNFVGNLPLNMVGMQKTWEQVYNSITDNVDARAYLNNMFMDLLADNEELKKALELEYSRLVTALGTVSGLGLGVVLASSQVAWVSLMARFMFENVWAQLAFSISIGIAADLPTIMIALFMSGKEMGLRLAKYTADFVDYVARSVRGENVKLIEMSSRSKKYLAVSLLVNAPLTYLAMNSSGPAKHAYYKNMPEDYQNGFWDFGVAYGAAVYNAINSFLAVHGAIKDTEIAYTPDGLESDRHRVRALQKLIKTAAPQVIEKIIKEDSTLQEDKRAQLFPPKQSLVTKFRSWLPSCCQPKTEPDSKTKLLDSKTMSYSGA